MMLENLRKEVLEANLDLIRRGLVIYTFGNASGISREHGLIAIKPSGVPFDVMKPEDMVLTDLDGRVVESKYRPSSDLATHVLLYKGFPGIGGVVHTHSRHATAWAQAGREIPCLGTTHADYFWGSIPVTHPLTAGEIQSAYEENTGHAILRAFKDRDPMQITAVLVVGHGPFCWGKDATDAAHSAVILEEVAYTSWCTVMLNPAVQPLPEVHRNKHFFRKHGAGATYGQSK